MNRSCPGRDAKTRTRMATCQRPAVIAAGAAAQSVPVLWSRRQVHEQTSFSNEAPFHTRAFERYLPQLPAQPSMKGLWPGGCDECSSCAVVGASGSLLKFRHGPDIDAHEVVLRANWLKLRNYEQRVGRKTSINVIFALENMVDQFEKAQRRLPPDKRAVGLVTSSSKRSLNSFFRYLGRRRLNRTLATDQPLYLLSDQLWLKATAHLCEATNGGCVWASRSSTMRPSSGFWSVLIALHACRNVSLFGLTSDDPCMPFHYYGSPPADCSGRIPKANDEHVHWFAKEHEIYRRWQREGRLRIFS